jgi:hypothetical protein
VIDAIDRDFDGVFDHQITWVIQLTAPDALQYTAQINTLDWDPDAGAAPSGGAQTGDDGGAFAWTTVDTQTTTVTRNCEGNSGFPTDGHPFTPFVPTSGPQPAQTPTIQVGPGGGDGTCDPNEASQLAAAIDCALTSGLKCLSESNPGEFGRLAAALAAKSAPGGGQVTPLEIGCGNSCSGVIASTQPYDAPLGFAALGPDSKMNINPNEFNSLSPTDQCSIMLHELMHWGGDPGSADHNSEMGKGDDAVYSCGRYCGKCSHAGHGDPGNSSVDCAKCVTSHKEQCGTQTQVNDGACFGALTGICHNGLACIAGDCDTCEIIDTLACDGTGLSEEVPCCQVCPTDCAASNDLPCMGPPPMTMNTCTNTTPPNCH